MATKAGVIAFLKFGVLIVGAIWLSLCVHEWMHLQVLTAVGGKGEIILTWSGAAVHMTDIPANVQIVYFAGGLLTAAFFALFFVFDWVTNDVPESCAVLPVIVAQTVYGLYEGFFLNRIPMRDFYAYGETVSIIGLIAGAIPAIWIALNYGVIEWLKPEGQS